MRLLFPILWHREIEKSLANIYSPLIWEYIYIRMDLREVNWEKGKIPKVLMGMPKKRNILFISVFIFSKGSLFWCLWIVCINLWTQPLALLRCLDCSPSPLPFLFCFSPHILFISVSEDVILFLWLSESLFSLYSVFSV